MDNISAAAQNTSLFDNFKVQQKKDKEVSAKTVNVPIKDTFEKKEDKKKSKEPIPFNNWQKANTITSCLLSGVFIVCGGLYLKNHFFQPKRIIQVYRDINKAMTIEQMSLPKGLENELKNFTSMIENPLGIIERGGKPIRTLLLYGPPGTGKTTFAKAIAKEIAKKGGGCKFAELDVSKLKDMYVGNTEKNINAAIDKICADANLAKAKYNAELSKIIDPKIVQKGDEKEIYEAIEAAKKKNRNLKVPQIERTVVFIDEIDSVMMVDTGNGAHFSNNVLNEFKKGLTEKLGKCDNIITIGATNLDIDPQKAKMAGKVLDGPMLDRFASKVRVPNPTSEQLRKTIMNNYGNYNLVESELKAESEELRQFTDFLSKERHGFSFRDLETLLSKTATRTNREGKKVSIEELKKTVKDDMLDSLNIDPKEMKNYLGMTNEEIKSIRNMTDKELQKFCALTEEQIDALYRQIMSTNI